MSTIDMLRALADHMQRHQLDDGSVMRAGLGSGDDLDVQVHTGPGADMAALLARWADSVQGAHITAKPVQDSFHVHVTGTVAGFPIVVVCVASGYRADQIRAALGLPAVPALPTGEALLDALATRQAAA